MDKNERKYMKTEIQGLRPIFLKKAVGDCVHYRGFYLIIKSLISNTAQQMSLKFKIKYYRCVSIKKP